MNKVVITPREVRGLGNIVSTKEVSDFTAHQSVLSLSSGVYTLTFDGTQFLLTVTAEYVASGNSVTVSVLLTDEHGDPVENASIGLYKVTE